MLGWSLVLGGACLLAVWTHIERADAFPPTDALSCSGESAARFFSTRVGGGFFSGVISGWACEAERVEIIFNGNDANPYRVGYGTSRGYPCVRSEENGFGMRWNLLGDRWTVDGLTSSAWVTRWAQSSPQGWRANTSWRISPTRAGRGSVGRIARRRYRYR